MTSGRKSKPSGERDPLRQAARGRDIPWQSVIQFHKEITRRAEEAFFSLPAGQVDSERWSSLPGLAPQEFAGPWEIAPDQVRSEGLRRLIRSETVEELYLGCSGFVRWSKGDRGGWFVDWAPVIYRQVEVRLDEQGGAELAPAQGKWEVSPLVFTLLDRKGSAPKRPLEDWLPELLEEAAGLAPNHREGLHGAVRDVLGREIPELGEELSKPFPQEKVSEVPTPWVLFAPPTTTSQYNRHLMADYEALEALFSDPGADPGGLCLLEDANPGLANSEIELLPIVALDDSQREAVERILGGQAVTVISGPPGCGKSQVVVSALLNCWSKGTSVLFASNNNKAVDVVRERVERFESDFPIAIRAGSRQASNLEEAIRRALNVVSGCRSGARSAGSTREKQNELLARKREIQGFLDSQVPQRADQALRSALKAYATFRETLDKLREGDAARRAELAKLGYSLDPAGFERHVAAPLRTWLEGIRESESEIERQRRNAERIEVAAKLEEAQRNRACQAVGLDPSSIPSWEWLASGPGPEGLTARLEALREVLGGPLEREFETREWSASFERWQGSEAASRWAEAAGDLARGVRSAVGRLEPVLAEIATSREELESRRSVLRERRIPEGVAPEPRLLDHWSGTWAEELTTPPGRLDWWLWSSRARRMASLHRVERKLRPSLPPSVWQSVGTLDRAGRERLSALIEDLQAWTAARSAWESLAGRRAEVEATFSTLRERAGDLQFRGAPATWEVEAWRQFADSVVGDAEIAQHAAAAWAHREQRSRATEKLRRTVAELDAFASGLPIKEAWLAGSGSGLQEAARELARDPGPETVVAARTALYSAPVAELVACWQAARAHDQRLRELASERAALPTERDLVAAWWGHRPAHLSRAFPTTSRLPAQDDPLFEHLALCEAWRDRWVRYRELERPELETQIRQESDWAREQLQTAQEALPRSLSAEKGRLLVAEVLAGNEDDWPIEALQSTFASFSPEALRSRIEQLDTDLEELAFDAARETWIDKLAEDHELQSTLDKLLKRYERNRGKILAEDYPLFQEALSALPIWITTAQAPQALPLLPGLFDLLVIDEATQCTLTNLLPLIYRAKRIAVIGDKEQLPAIPTLTAGAEQALARNYGVGHLLDLLGHSQNTVYSTFVDCLPRRHSDVTNLAEHYRSHPLIIGFSNEHVYRKRLRLRKEPDSGVKVPCGPGVFVRDVEGQCKRGDRNQSWQNRREAEAVMSAIADLRKDSRFVHFSLGVVTPFRPQVDLISELLDRNGLSRGVVVGTAHRFQGDECDVMVFSPVVAPGISDSAASWVEKPHNLINVAVTRAREALLLICHLPSCRQQPGILGRLAVYVEQVETLRATSLEELDLFSWMVVQGWSPEVHPRVGDIEVDFVLRHEGRRLAIEVDGAQHDWSTVADAARDAFLKSRGYLTLRVPARAVRETPAVCIERIEAALAASGDPLTS